MNTKNTQKDISINVGAGVPKADINLDSVQSDKIEKEVEEIIPFEYDEHLRPTKIQYADINDKFIRNSVGQKVYWNKPFFKGQSRSNGLYKFGPPKIQVFKLDSPEAITAYNEFLAQMGGQDDDPTIVNVNIERQFWEGHFIVLVSYNEVWYSLPEQK